MASKQPSHTANCQGQGTAGHSTRQDETAEDNSRSQTLNSKRTAPASSHFSRTHRQQKPSHSGQPLEPAPWTTDAAASQIHQQIRIAFHKTRYTGTNRWATALRGFTPHIAMQCASVDTLNTHVRLFAIWLKAWNTSAP